ncbi:MAG: hypothetical protein IJP83_00205, partial [Mycoplasma sp.]|nr:hypothetical protein [Mycoplasma sp.]
GEYKGNLNVSGLATSGMMINGMLLIDILNQAGKISLSGGSHQLNGIVKKADKDANQWKLTVDGNEIKNEDISWKLVSATTEKLPDSIRINDGVVSWTDKIETAGTYSFYVLANYKETKIQTDLITLNISSKQSECIQSFNNQTRNTLYDENTIDQKLLDFVRYVHFSLDYTENDYNTDKDGKKGEILVNNIIIGYKNSKNTFTVSNLDTKKAISSAINNDSGITSRCSDSLYNNVKVSYNSVVKLTLTNDTADTFFSVSSKLKDLLIASTVLDSISAVLSTIGIIAIILTFCTSWKEASTKCAKFKKIISTIFSVGCWLAGLYFVYSDGSGIANILDNAGECYKFVNGEKSKLVNHINTDKNKLSDKDNFCKISTGEQRRLKSYYDKDYEKDLEEFYGGKDNLEKITNDYDEELEYKIIGLIKKIPFMIALPAMVLFLTWDYVLKGFDAVKNAIIRIRDWLVSGLNLITHCIHH